MVKFLILILILFLLNNETFSQKPSCNEDKLMLSYMSEKIKKHPELRTDMPMNVINAYIRYDSLRRLGINELVASIYKIGLGKDYFSLLSEYYTLNDYDPVLFFKNSSYYDSNYKYQNDYANAIFNYIEDKDPNKFIINSIVSSTNILHIKVLDTIRRYSPYEEEYGGIITSEIIDVLKGNTVPGTKDLRIPDKNENFIVQNPEYNIAETGTVFHFDYFLEYLMDIKISFTHPDGSQWIKKGNEYIVFLKFLPVCNDVEKKKHYFTLRPWNFDSPYFLMYEIREGILIDDFDDFGFGKNISVNEWKKKFRELVQRIKNGNPSSIEENKNDIFNNSLFISPNPATDFITINPGNEGLKHFAETDEQVEIYNSLGELVLKDVAHLRRVDVSHLPVGLYFVKIGNRVEKFVKM